MTTIAARNQETPTMATADRPDDYQPLTRDEQTTIAQNLDIDVILTNIDAGHRMAGMALTDEDKESLRRVDRGETTIDEERARLIAELGLDDYRG